MQKLVLRWDVVMVCIVTWTWLPEVGYMNLSRYLKLGCNNVDMHSCPLCSHSQTGVVTVTLRQAQQDELSEHYQYLSTLSELVRSADRMWCLYCTVCLYVGGNYITSACLDLW